jgi:D-threo-aldose 1-dehydrogenase
MIDLGRGPFWFGGAGIGNLRHAVDDQTAADTIDAAWNAGIRAFDTAPHYGLGLSERRLGSALAGRARDEFIVSTKVGRILEPSTGGAETDLANGFDVPATHRRRWDATADGIRRSLDASRERLGLERIDVAYLHDPDEHDLDAALACALPALAGLRDAGELSAVGVGSKSVAALTKAVRTGVPDVIMVAGRYTLLEQPGAGLIAECAERGVSVIAAGVFNSGLLSQDVPEASAHYEYGAAPSEVVDRARAIAVACRRHGVTLPEAALAFPLRAPAVVANAVGVQTPQQVNENVERSRARVPEMLWTELAAHGLI